MKYFFTGIKIALITIAITIFLLSLIVLYYGISGKDLPFVPKEYTEQYDKKYEKQRELEIKKIDEKLNKDK